MSIFTTTIFLLFFIVIELLYFKIADRFNIIDKPNFRSSHKQITIRGGGIIFAIGVLIYFTAYGFPYPYFTLGLLVISAISFADDVKPVSNRLRIICHFISVLLLFYQLDILQLASYLLIICFVIAIGTINAINFMDGINGLTGTYSLVALVTLWCINDQLHANFISNNLIITALLSVIAFNIFNFRAKAKCFAGDVGSVGIAFILIFLIGSLILKSGNVCYLLLLLVYGLDTVTTIFFRLMRKENIFDAHRSHFYQFLANERKVSHRLVSIIYAIVQLLFNFLLIIFEPKFGISVVLVTIAIGLVFIGLRFFMEGKHRLLGK